MFTLLVKQMDVRMLFTLLLSSMAFVYFYIIPVNLTLRQLILHEIRHIHVPEIGVKYT